MNKARAVTPSLDIASRYIPFSQATNAMKLIRRLIRTGSLPDGADVSFLVGPTGSGKSKVLAELTNMPEFQPTTRGGDDIRPIVISLAPHQATTKVMAETLLKALGQRPGNWRTSDLEDACVGNLIDQKTRLVIFDEVQQLTKSPHVAADFFKSLSNRSKVPIVLSGNAEALRMLEANAQLKRRNRHTIRMEAFDWRVKEQRIEFASILATYDSRLARDHQVRCDGFSLREHAVAKRIYIVSRGLIGGVSKLIRCALDIIEEEKSKLITLDILREAAGLALDGADNPFDVEDLGDLPENPKPAPFETGSNPDKIASKKAMTRALLE